MLVATKYLTAKLHLLFVKKSESELFERSELESDILPSTPQPCTAPDKSLMVVLQIRAMCRASSSILQKNIVASEQYCIFVSVCIT